MKANSVYVKHESEMGTDLQRSGTTGAGSLFTATPSVSELEDS